MDQANDLRFFSRMTLPQGSSKLKPNFRIRPEFKSKQEILEKIRFAEDKARDFVQSYGGNGISREVLEAARTLGFTFPCSEKDGYGGMSPPAVLKALLAAEVMPLKSADVLKVMNDDDGREWEDSLLKSIRVPDDILLMAARLQKSFSDLANADNEYGYDLGKDFVQSFHVEYYVSKGQIKGGAFLKWVVHISTLFDYDFYRSDNHYIAAWDL
jgi:hypothetical protein